MTFIFSVEKYILYINFHFIIWISSDRASLNKSLKSLIMVTRIREIFSMYGSRAGLMPNWTNCPQLGFALYLLSAVQVHTTTVTHCMLYRKQQLEPRIS